MKQSVILLFIGIVLIGTSCSTMKKSTASTISIDSGVTQYPTVADLEVKQKIIEQISWNFVPFNYGELPLKLREKNFIADIIKENDADILVETQVTYTKKPYGKRTLTVTGFPACFKYFRKASEEALRALEVTKPALEKEVYQVSRSWYNKLFSKKD